VSTQRYEDDIRFDEVLRREAAEAMAEGDREAADRLMGLCIYPEQAARRSPDIHVLAPSGFGGTNR
jgi:hypothetical protein